MKILKTLLACVLVASSIFALSTIKANAETEFDIVINAEITRINNEQYVSSSNAFVMHLSETDYMTAEWDYTDYKWYNAEENADYETVDINSYNLCNFPLDKNLEEYNFEQKILIDGVTLAEYKVTHPYKLVGNMRTRVDTIALYFIEPVLKDVSTIEVLDGCELPTLARACIGSRNKSCIRITKGVKYENHSGTWAVYFEGWKEGVEYDGDEQVFHLSLEEKYKGHNATPLYEFADVFKKEETLAGGLYRGLALASTSNTQKGYITVLRFINPIKAEEFNTLNLRLYTNNKRTIYAYNDSNITEDSLGIALQSFTLDGAVHTTVNLMTSLYADPDGMVRTIVFKFNEDGEPFINSEGEEVYDENGNLIRDQLFFVSFNLENQDKLDLLTKDSFIIVDNGDVYDITFRFNRKTVDTGVALDKSKVTLNGQTLAKVLAECKTASAKWTTIGLVTQIDLTLPKSYAGASQIKNAETGFSGNSMGVLKGLKFPDGTVLSKSYTCHIYIAEKILDSEMEIDNEKTSVLDIKYGFVPGSNNLHFKIRFDKKITSSNYYHACEIERWRETDLYASSSLYYDKGMSNVFVKNGYKSSLLDSIVINGKSIGEWHACDARALTNIQTHYGQSGLEYVDVHFESNSALTYSDIAELAKDGNGITIEIKQGLKFMTNCQVKKTQTFVLKNGVFSEVVPEKNIHVYYDGTEVQNGEDVTVMTAVDPASIVVTGVANYQVSHETNDKTTEFTIIYGEGKSFTFTVFEDSVEVEKEPGISDTPTQQTNQTKKKGCKSSVELPIVGLTLVLLASILILKERKIHE